MTLQSKGCSITTSKATNTPKATIHVAIPKHTDKHTDVHASIINYK